MTRQDRAAKVSRQSPGAGARRVLSLSVLFALFAAACHEKLEQPAKPAQSAPTEALTYGLTKAQSSQAVAKFGDTAVTAITAGQFAERLNQQAAYLTARYNSVEGRRTFLDDMVRFELLGTEAEKRGYDKKADVERAQKRAMVEQMMGDLFEKQGLKLSDITDAEIKKYYDDNRSEFDKPGGVTQTLENARIVIQNRLWQAKRSAAIEKFMADLRNKADVKETLDLLDKVHVDTDVPAVEKQGTSTTRPRR